MIIQRLFSSKKEEKRKKNRENLAIQGGLGTAGMAYGHSLAEREGALNSAILTYKESAGMDTAADRAALKNGGRFNQEAYNAAEQRIKNTGGWKANEKTIKEAVKKIEKSGKELNGTQKKVLSGMKETAEHMRNSRYAKNVAKVGLGVAGIGAGAKIIRNLRKDKDDNKKK